MTANGIKDAKRIAKRLKNKKFQVAYQTRLSRSKDTLKPVLKYHQECKKIITDAFVEKYYNDISGGRYQDCPESDKPFLFSYADINTKRNLSIKTTRIVKLHLKYERAIATRLEHIKHETENKLRGKFFLFVSISL